MAGWVRPLYRDDRASSTWHVARDKGFYRQAGLNVVLEGGLGSFSNVQLVAAGKTQIAHVASPAARTTSSIR